MVILFANFPSPAPQAEVATPMTVIGMDVHQRYCQVALLDDGSTDPQEQRLTTERAELEGAKVAFEATRNHWFVYDCLDAHLDLTVANPAKTGLIGDPSVKNDRLDAKRLVVLL